jgi:hypothetical protein
VHGLQYQAQASAILTTVIQDAALVDLRADRHPDDASQPTYKFGGIKTPPLVNGEPGTSAIDFSFANEAANCLVSDLRVIWDLCEDCEHVPLDIILDAEAFNATIDVVDKPSQITTAKLAELTDHAQNTLYRRIRDEGKYHYDILCTTHNPTVAHLQWSIICEVFSHAWLNYQRPQGYFADRQRCQLR